MKQPLAVIGAGGFGRETLDVVDAINATRSIFDLLGVVDDAPSELKLKRLADRNVAYLGTTEQWLAQGPEAAYVIGVGSPPARRRIASLTDLRRYPAAILVHPSATVGSMSSLGAGTIICAGVQVSTNVRLGEHVHLNPNATIGHDAVLEDFVSVNPAATISGDCLIGTATLVGAGAVVLQGRAVGVAAVVGAAACVVRDVPAKAIVKGVPAR